MNRTTLIRLIGSGVVLSFLLACGKNEPAGATDPSATSGVHAGHAGMDGIHDHGAHVAKENKPVPSAVKNGFDRMPAPGTLAHCPVMKHDFKVAADSTFSVYKGKTYVFCCPGCKPQFEADPDKFVHL